MLLPGEQLFPPALVDPRDWQPAPGAAGPTAPAAPGAPAPRQAPSETPEGGRHRAPSGDPQRADTPRAPINPDFR